MQSHEHLCCISHLVEQYSSAKKFLQLDNTSGDAVRTQVQGNPGQQESIILESKIPLEEMKVN